MPTESEALERVRIGARIRALRTDRGLTVEALAAAVGCSRPHLSNIEGGRSRADTATRTTIAGVLGLSLDELEQAS